MRFLNKFLEFYDKFYTIGLILAILSISNLFFDIVSFKYSDIIGYIFIGAFILFEVLRSL